MKRGLTAIKKPSKNKNSWRSFLDRIRALLLWLPGFPDLSFRPRESSLPPTQAWTETCPDTSLRCLGCEEYLEAPVKQCVNGHSVCAKCRRVLPSCPTCGDHFIRTPQPLLDRLLRTTRLPCVYAAFGCPVLEVLRHRDSHSRVCTYRPSACPLCTWESPPRPSPWPSDRRHGQGDLPDDSPPGEQLLAQHMTSAHKHHALQLDREHVLSAWLESKNQGAAFLSCTITADNQVFVFVMNYDITLRRFFVVLKHVGSLCKETIAKTNSSSQNRVPTKKKSKVNESSTESGEPPKTNEPENRDIAPDKIDSFERTGNEGMSRGEQSCEYGYLVELMDNKCIQALRFVQTALNKEDALDLAVKSGRCLGVDLSLIDRLLEPGNGQFTVKMTVSRIETTVDNAFANSVDKNVNETVLLGKTAFT